MSTLEVIERIEQEIDSVKNNCLAMNHELYTLHDVRPSITASGESENDLAELAPIILPPSSFKGMLTFTAIPDEISDTASNASDFSPSRVQLSLLTGWYKHLVTYKVKSIHQFVFFFNYSDEDGMSMEWDNHDLLPTSFGEKKPIEKESIIPAPIVCPTLPLNKNGKFLEVQSVPVGPEWCSQESGYLEWEGTPGSEASTSFTSASILSPLQEKRYANRETSTPKAAN